VDGEAETAPVEEPLPETFDPILKEFAALASDFEATGVLRSDARIKPLREKVTRFNDQRVATEPSIATEIQLLYWSSDFTPARDRAFARLEALPELSPGLRVAWADFLVTRHRYDEAMEVLDRKPIDANAFPQAIILRAKCLATDSRYDEAEAALAELASVARLTPEMLDDAHRVRHDLIDDFREAWLKERSIREAEAAAGDLPRVEITTSRGAFVVELYENQAPNTVANFLSLIEQGFYNSMKFHAVVPGMWVQSGDPSQRTAAGVISAAALDYTIKDELPEGTYRPHFAGVISMQSSAPDSAASEFVITLRPQSARDGRNTAFGRVIEGMRLVRLLTTDDSILDARVLRKRDHAYSFDKIPLTPAAPPPTPADDSGDAPPVDSAEGDGDGSGDDGGSR